MLPMSQNDRHWRVDYPVVGIVPVACKRLDTTHLVGEWGISTREISFFHILSDFTVFLPVVKKYNRCPSVRFELGE
jgi:hypothetical protein